MELLPIVHGILRHLGFQRPLVLVHQIGKVGSTSIVRALNRRVFSVEAYQTHFLDPTYIRRRIETIGADGKKVPKHFRLGAHLGKNVLPRAAHIHVVTALRDPIAFAVSGFFQNLTLLHDISEDTPVSRIGEVFESFLDKADPREVSRWFETELKSNFGIDVLRTPFDQDREALTVWNERVSLILVKAESSNEIKQGLLSEFLGIEGLILPRTNVGARKSYAELYSRFKEDLVMPLDLIERYYADPVVAHVYTQDEIAAFKHLWAGT